MALDPADIATLSRLLDAGLARPATEREAWLAALPPEHQRHTGQLRQMLAAHEAACADPRLDTLPRLGPAPDDAAVAAAGQRVGAYSLIREIGRGGMGSVWLAERADGNFKRQVALKLPRLAWGAGLAERMAREREIGALLEHPNIARLYDAGVDERGRPFMALEYIDGQPIDAWCEAQGLSVTARLRLFVQVARAVAYAHGRLVVHRDLKPSNVMVTADGQAHLLDFGIAKLLHEAGEGTQGLTQAHERVMTLHYASPEQVAGTPITVQSDVYSLGVLLYQLLTGVLPIESKRGTLGAVEDAILQGDAALASSRVKNAATARALRGEVDAILAKAMQRDPTRRYATADAMAQDIERHLNGETVSARPDSWAYRLRKLVMRQKLAFGASVVVLSSVAIGATASLIQAQRAARESERSRLATEFVTELFAINSQQRPPGFNDGAQAPASFLDRGAQLIKTRFQGQPDIQARLFGAVGKVYADMGAGALAVQYAGLQNELLQGPAADRREQIRALLLLAKALTAQDSDQEAELQLKRAVDLARADDDLRAEALARLARNQQNNGKPQEAKRSAEEAERLLSIGQHAPSLAPADVLLVKAAQLQNAEKFDEALAMQQRATDMALLIEGPASPYALMVRLHVAITFAARRRVPEARAFMDAALLSVHNTGGAGEIGATWRAAQIWSVMYGRGLVSYPEATAAVEQIGSFVKSRAAVIPPILRAKVDFYAGTLQLQWGDLDNAEALLLPSLRQLRQETTWLILRQELVSVGSQLAIARGRHDEADVLLREQQELGQGWGPQYRASGIPAIARNLSMQGKYEEAEALLVTMSRMDPSPASPNVQAILATRGRVLLDSGDAQAALVATQDLDLRNPPAVSRSRKTLRGEILCAAGQPLSGLPLLQEAVEEWTQRVGPNKPDLARLRAVAGQCALASGDRTRAMRFAELSRAAFTAQPGVSPYFKAPLNKLERALGLRLPPI